MSKKTQATAAGQSSAAAKTTKTAPKGAAPANTGKTATATIEGAAKMPPKKRVAAPKVAKESKRVVGVTLNVATTTYNNWRNWIRFLLNGNDKNVPMIARFIKTKEAKGTEWGGYISTPAANVKAVVAKLEAFTASEAHLPVAEQSISMWTMLEHFTQAEPKVRAPRKAKATAEVTA